MLLRTHRYEVGSDKSISIADASKNPTLLVGSDKRISIADASRNPTLLSEQQWKNLLLETGKLSIGVPGCFCYSIAKCGQRRRSPGARREHREVITNTILRYI